MLPLGMTICPSDLPPDPTRKRKSLKNVEMDLKVTLCDGRNGTSGRVSGTIHDQRSSKMMGYVVVRTIVTFTLLVKDEC